MKMNFNLIGLFITLVLLFSCDCSLGNGPTHATNANSQNQQQNLVGPDAITAANKKALRQPNSKNYTNSIMKFNYADGALYHIYTAPLRITDVQFREDERITSVGAGDTARWQVSKTYSGSGDERHEHLLLKPMSEDLENIIVVTTDQRTYHLILSSTEKTFMAEVTWSYPKEKKTPSYDATQNAATEEPPIDIKNMDFGYELKILKGTTPDWYPTMIFNDGKKTYIKFSSNMQEAPTLFAGNDTKSGEVVNYRVVGNYYIVDSLLWQAQLRSGQDNQVILQISHKAN